jgi:hypothetical protein
MSKKQNDFVVTEGRAYKFQMGKHIASGLSGFLAGVIFSSIIWILIFIYYKDLIVGN